ncbi:MAG: hypothetical protein PUC14_00380 [Bacteroidales bacterium]|nr:hypothetical protein [Bacteroidales bacterium]MDD5974185.1 hypothetical protein [Bacteroidales bacterium]MDY5193817.1 hypothetical protein [Candidatus Aphodosoma sp.]
MKKINLLIIILLSIFLISCNGKKADNNEESSLIKSVSGIYTNDTTALDFKSNGTCEIITADTIITGDYVWDVDTTNIAIIDQNQNLMLLRVSNPDTLISQTNNIYHKRK